MAEAPAIETRGLSKHYGRIQAVRELDLTVSPGEIFGFLGPNGAGKTTTIRMLMGLIRPSGGQAAIFGRPCSWVGARADGMVGAMVETPSFYDYLSGRENLEMYSRLSSKVEPAEVDRALDLVGMSERAAERVRGYSHGMRQRLGLALAILPLPRLLIVDEPALGLDPQGLTEVRDLLLGLNREHGVTVFLSSHLLHEVELTCTDVGVLISGRLIARGKVAELLAAPEQVLELTVDDPARAAELLSHFTTISGVEVAGQTVKLTCPREQVSEVNALLVGQGVRVCSLCPRTATLEELYLRLMEREHHAASVAPGAA